ncbi:hypothetical protein [Pantoea sp.]|uniref:hypothetical protein n=1 Tax=Pantoea sp. TaxID=69393 RepID=UPI0028ADF314|nr:hypothetical protein [Pantoea sp.]
MKKLFSIIILAVILSGCDFFYSPPSDEWIIKKVQENYLEYVRSSNASAKCLTSQSIVPEGVEMKRNVKSNCNSEIDPMQGAISFSDFKVYKHKDHTSVCGVASGFTSFKQKTGIRMIVTDKDMKSFTWKRPTYDLAYLPYSDAELSKSMKKIMSDELLRYAEAEKTECHN